VVFENSRSRPKFREELESGEGATQDSEAARSEFRCECLSPGVHVPRDSFSKVGNTNLHLIRRILKPRCRASARKGEHGRQE
jgi:hypothetical protein